MYDYVLQYGFDKKSQEYIQNIKEYLKINNVEDKERNWLPHITIDLYNCKEKEEFLQKVDCVIKDLTKLCIECNNLNDFNKETLYIEPFNKERLLEIKDMFDRQLYKYRLENRKNREYKPHITLCTNNDIDENIYDLANKKFNPISVEIKYIWVYNQKMKLVKEYELN